MYRPARKSRNPLFCRSRTRRSSSLFADARCCRLMIASMHCSRQSRISRDLPCIAVCSATALANCQMWTARNPRRRSSQGLSNRLLPHRHRRSADRRRQAPSLRRHRSNVEVRLRRVAREGYDENRRRFPSPSYRGSALQNSNSAHRQRPKSGSNFPLVHCPSNFTSGSWIGSSPPHREPCGNRRRRIGCGDRSGE